VAEAYRPVSLGEALEILKDGNIIPLAGGTDLMVHRRVWSGVTPNFSCPVIFIGYLDELRGVEVERDAIAIGASSTLSSLLECEDLPELLHDAIADIAGPSIRNRATIGGNICNASPAADSLPALYALEAEVVLEHAGGTRSLPIDEFIKGPGETCLVRGEILTSIRVPKKKFELSLFRKLGTRRAYSCAKLSLGGAASTEGERVSDVRLALGSVAPTIVRSKEAEASLLGKTGKEISDGITDILGYYDALVSPIDDQRSTSAYRRKVSLRLIRYFLEDVLLPQLGG
jgi:CO/xanthine dehydrogenase FAD-binding subunit